MMLGRTTSNRRGIVIAMLALLVLAGTLAGCQKARVGTRCRTTAFAEDGGAWILQCRKGRWVRALTKADYARLLLALRSRNTTPGAPGTPGAPATPGGPGAPTTTVPPVPLIEATQISGGFDHSCARMSNGTLRCWGSGFSGQLGDGQTLSGDAARNRLRAIQVLNLTTAVSVSAGGAFTCARLADGTGWCWGDNKGGELGGAVGNISTPRQLPELSNAVSIDAGWAHACAVVSGGTVKCWGVNNRGQLGTNAAGLLRNAPTEIGSLTGATSVGSGEDYSCATVAGGAVRCWGDNRQGQLGNGTPSESSATPVNVIGGVANATSLTVGRAHACAVTSGSIRCWGDNASGQLGNGSTTDSATPITVSGITNAVAVSAGKDHTCALLSTGAMQCWGDNTHGQLGTGNNTPSTTPAAVSGVAGVDAMSAGDFHTCAHLPDNTIRCWGFNATGQLGNTTQTSSNVPVQVLT